MTNNKEQAIIAYMNKSSTNLTLLSNKTGVSRRALDYIKQGKVKPKESTTNAIFAFIVNEYEILRSIVYAGKSKKTHTK